MTDSKLLRMPSLGGATGWLTSEPLGPAELRGCVVLVNHNYGDPWREQRSWGD